MIRIFCDLLLWDELGIKFDTWGLSRSRVVLRFINTANMFPSQEEKEDHVLPESFNWLEDSWLNLKIDISAIEHLSIKELTKHLGLQMKHNVNAYVIALFSTFVFFLSL